MGKKKKHSRRSSKELKLILKAVEKVIKKKKKKRCRHRSSSSSEEENNSNHSSSPERDISDASVNLSLITDMPTDPSSSDMQRILIENTLKLEVTYSAGRLSNFLPAWRSVTSDPLILSWISGYKIPFIKTPVQTYFSPNQTFSNKENEALLKMIPQLVKKGAIAPCDPLPNQFISPIFLEPKPDGNYRLILNLKKLNSFMSPEHFKLEDFRVASRLITPGCFMAKLDLKDAYYLIAIDRPFRKFLRFMFHDTLYEFTCLPFGLCTAPYVFTKILKPVVCSLRQAGYTSVVYLDDFLLLGHSKNACIENVASTCTLLSKLGFIFSASKCQFPPQTSCQYLGFVFDSLSMSISLPIQKRTAMMNLIQKMETCSSCSIRSFAQFLGSLAACCPAIKYGWAYTKKFERDKYLALQHANDNYNATMMVEKRDLECEWWRKHIVSGFMPLNNPLFVLEIYSDASLTGWGISCHGNTARGTWTSSERKLHINHLELLAALFGLQLFAKNIFDAHILLRIDNTTAIAYINRMGGILNPLLNEVAFQIWQFCEASNLFVFASYIRSADNADADAESRKLDVETEYELSCTAFRKITARFGQPEIDLFASRLNCKCTRYFSWKCDPGSEAIDAFTVPWKNLKFYAFPPFSIILRTLQKIQREGAEGIMVVPYWPGQPWFPVFSALCVTSVLTLEPSKTLLRSSDRTPHPLWKNLSLVAGVLSGKQ